MIDMPVGFFVLGLIVGVAFVMFAIMWNRHR